VILKVVTKSEILIHFDAVFPTHSSQPQPHTHTH